MELSKRLQTVASAVTPGSRVADIGTDHGYVPIYLIKNNLCPQAFALDVNAGPLARAQEHVQAEGLTDRIETRLGNGLEPVNPEEVDTVVIAGMGGDLICRILQAAPSFFSAGKEFVLQPQSEWFKVRHFLHDMGYHIEKEWFLKEDGKYYVILKADVSADGCKEKYPDEFAYQYGACLLEERNSALIEYLENEMKKKKNILSHLEKGSSIDSAEARENPENKEKRQLRCQMLKKEVEDITSFLIQSRTISRVMS